MCNLLCLCREHLKLSQDFQNPHHFPLPLVFLSSLCTNAATSACRRGAGAELEAQGLGWGSRDEEMEEVMQKDSMTSVCSAAGGIRKPEMCKNRVMSSLCDFSIKFQETHCRFLTRPLKTIMQRQLDFSFFMHFHLCHRRKKQLGDEFWGRFRSCISGFRGFSTNGII